ncbi:hypothetical protein OROHE_010502 [Orobanche hederae]
MDPGNEKAMVQKLETLLAGLSLVDGPEVPAQPQAQEFDFDMIEGLFYAIRIGTNNFENPMPLHLRAKARAALARWIAIYSKRLGIDVPSSRRYAASSGGAAASSGGAAASSSVAG